jgi:hypothetical protein
VNRVPLRAPCLVAVLLTVLCAAWVDVNAQDATPRLQEAKSLKCNFTLLATGSWTKEGEPLAEVKSASLALGFSSIDTQEGTADISGTMGAPNIVVQFSGGSLHFMQVGSGFLYVTTVFEKLSRPGKLKAVHTRHEFTDIQLPGFTSRPEQYYGECEVLP